MTSNDSQPDVASSLEEVASSLDEHSQGLQQALKAVFISPNESDSNLEPANVVDGLFAIARSIDRLADAVGHAADASSSS